MKVRFYFDYSDYRSYLMLHSLSVLDDLPVTVQRIAVDAYSLRALSGCDAYDPSIHEHNYLVREAVRFCHREGIDFVWQDTPRHSGSALRAAVWLMRNASPIFDEFSEKVLKMIWGLGKNVDAACVKNILTELDLSPDEVFLGETERDNFQFQDACLQQALADGVFDVPAVVIGSDIVCHFDQAREIRRLALMEWMMTLPHETVVLHYVNDLLALETGVFRHRIAGISRKLDVRESASLEFDTSISQIQHNAPAADTQWHLPRLPVRGDFPCCLCPCPASGSDENRLRAAFAASRENALNICACTHLNIHQDSVLEDMADSSLTPRYFCARIIISGTPAVLFARVDAGGGIHTDILSVNSKTDYIAETMRGWGIAVISPAAAVDPVMARLAAYRGTHIIIHDSEDAVLPGAEAFGCISASWIIDLTQNGVYVVDAVSQRALMKSDDTVNLSASFKLASGNAWNPPAPRTLLLCDKSLTLGEIGSGANIELGARGLSLLAAAAQQSSELSATRVYERIRLDENSILLMPVAGEQIFVSELLAHRIIEAYNSAPREAVPIFVNYWCELDFDMLQVMRPVHNITAAAMQIPVVLVVGSQIVEVWIPTPQGSAYLIEKCDDHFTIDLAELNDIGHSIARIAACMKITDKDWLARLDRLDAAVR